MSAPQKPAVGPELEPGTERAAVPPQQTPGRRPPAAAPVTDARSRGGNARWIWAAAAGLFVLYTALSWRDHYLLRTRSYDLGIFEQVVRSYAEGHLPVSELKGPGFPVLGDHFSPVLAALAPLYQMWSSPYVLLLAQAALVAAAVVPLAKWAQEELGRRVAVAVAVGYGLSWGVAAAVDFDFHEVAFAVPLLAGSLAALGRGRLGAAAGWALPLLLVKEDLGLTVAVIGLLIAYRGRRRLGLITAGAGVAGSLLALFVILPAFNPDGSFAYWSNVDGGTQRTSADWLYQVTVGLVTPDEKMLTLLLVLAPSACLALRSPLMWVALPTLIWRFTSSNPAHWGFYADQHYHYSLVLMPIVCAAFIDALIKQRNGGQRLRPYLITSLALTAVLLPSFPLWRTVQPATWRTDPHVAAAQQVMDRIPDGATVQASSYLTPHLTGRTSLSLFGYPASRPNPEWIVVDQARNDGWPLSPQQEGEAIAAATKQGYRLVTLNDGVLLLRRGS